MRYLIKFSYDGTNYSGFQKQKGLNTIEEKLEEALTKINNGKKLLLPQLEELIRVFMHYANMGTLILMLT